jgi:hypothetical protein
MIEGVNSIMIRTSVNVIMYPKYNNNTQKKNKGQNRGRIQDGDWGTEADSVSSMSQGPCWDTGAMFGGGEAPRRVETSTPWTPSPWKASPHHVKRTGGLLPATSSKPAWKTLGIPNECPASRSTPPATPGINQHSVLGRQNPPPHTQKKIEKNKLKTSTQQRGQGWT